MLSVKNPKGERGSDWPKWPFFYRSKYYDVNDYTDTRTEIYFEAFVGFQY